MKLAHKIVLGNTLGIICIILVAAFSYREFDLMLAKMRFIEIADNLNASFLKMRISEKNYFLYKDKLALQNITKQIERSYSVIEELKPSIIKAIGEENFRKLKLYLKQYEQSIQQIETTNDAKAIREAGRKLRLFSEDIIKIERDNVNRIIFASKRTLLTFFVLVVFTAIISTYVFFSRMFRSLRRIERTANAISKGNFVKIKDPIPNNELGSVMAAINSMCEELQTRHELLIQSRKLSSIGTLIAGVAHELGNPLNNISMVAQTFIEVYDDLSDEERIEFMETVIKETQRIKDIVQNLVQGNVSRL